VDPDPSAALELARLPFIDALQLHGSESPDFCQMLAERGIDFAKALPVSENQVVADIPNFFTDTVLLDSASDHRFGGSGISLPWMIGRRFVESHPDLKVILAGGLNPENVADAIRQVGPFGVDVASGVESSPGRKDWNRLRAFLAAVRSTSG
jgi:phosphoribosylanthranilate isomerase